MKSAKLATVDEYIAGFPQSTQTLLNNVRKAVKETAPDAEESVSYGIAAYKYKGKPLFYFGGFEKHVGLYATPGGQSAFTEELSKYKQGKGSVQIPIDQAMPVALIKKMVKYNMKTIAEKAVSKSK